MVGRIVCRNDNCGKGTEIEPLDELLQRLGISSPLDGVKSRIKIRRKKMFEKEFSCDAIPELRKGSAFEEWAGGGYPVEPVIEMAFFKEENKDKLSSCVLCGRTLTHPLSVRRHIGPECMKKVAPYGKIFIQGDEVSQTLLRASEAYSKEQFQKWIIKAVLTLGAPFPEITLAWLGEEYFGYSHKPSLYYVDGKGVLNCLEIKQKQLKHRQITSLSTCENQLDYHASGMIKTDDPKMSLEVRETTEDAPLPEGYRTWLVIDKEGWRHMVWRNTKDEAFCTCHQEKCLHIQAIPGQKMADPVSKRKIQMDKKHRIWIIEADGSKKKISCREICEQFETKNPNIVTRLRAAIDNGADLSVVEVT